MTPTAAEDLPQPRSYRNRGPSREAMLQALHYDEAHDASAPDRPSVYLADPPAAAPRRDVRSSIEAQRLAHAERMVSGPSRGLDSVVPHIAGLQPLPQTHLRPQSGIERCELEYVLAVGYGGQRLGQDAWTMLTRHIKDRRGGLYPSDWTKFVFQQRIFLQAAEAANPLRRFTDTGVQRLINEGVGVCYTVSPGNRQELDYIEVVVHLLESSNNVPNEGGFAQTWELYSRHLEAANSHRALPRPAASFTIETASSLDALVDRMHASALAPAPAPAPAPPPPPLALLPSPSPFSAIAFDIASAMFCINSGFCFATSDTFGSTDRKSVLLRWNMNPEPKTIIMSWYSGATSAVPEYLS